VTNLQTELDGKEDSLGFTPEDSANKGVAGGYASLDGTTKLPAAQLPSHDIDDNTKHGGVSGATEDNFASFDSNGLPQDSGQKDADYVHKSGTETITGAKTFSNGLTVSGGITKLSDVVNIDDNVISLNVNASGPGDGGFSVFRGVVNPVAALIWTEAESKFKAGLIGSEEPIILDDDLRLTDDRDPNAHDLAGTKHNPATLAELSAKVSDNTLIGTDDSRLSDARTPTTHGIAGSEHSSDTLANLNAKISDTNAADDAAVVHDTGAETIGGNKTFSDFTTLGTGNVGIKIFRLTGTTPAQGATATIALPAGVTAAKCFILSAKVDNAAGTWYSPNHGAFTGSVYYTHWLSSVGGQFVGMLVGTGAWVVASSPIEFLILHIP